MIASLHCKEKKPMTDYKYDQVEVALEMLEAYLNDDDSCYPRLRAVQDSEGMSATRCEIIYQATLALTAFEPHSEDNGHCFDWEVLPAAMTLVFADENPLLWSEAMSLAIAELNKAEAERRNK